MKLLSGLIIGVCEEKLLNKTDRAVTRTDANHVDRLTSVGNTWYVKIK